MLVIDQVTVLETELLTVVIFVEEVEQVPERLTELQVPDGGVNGCTATAIG